MQITVNIFTDKDSFTQTAEEVAAEILSAIDGDPEKDTCTVTLSWTPESGSAGAIPTMPGMTQPPVPTPTETPKKKATK